MAEDDEALLTFARNIGLDMKKWASDLESDEVRGQLLEDINQANGLGINATPSVFINGRKVNGFQESILEFIIEKELDK